jgi:hypothetical protein
MNTHDLDLLEINLQKEIDNPKHKHVCTFETRVDLLAYDCLKAIRSLREQVKEKWNTRVEVEDKIKKIERIIQVMTQKTIFLDDNGKIVEPPNVDDYCLDDLMIFNHGKLEAYKSVLEFLREEVQDGQG